MKSTAIILLAALSGCTSVIPSKDWSVDRFDTRTRTSLAQIGLRSEGFTDIPVDGVVGPRTRSAALSFRKSRGLPQSDKVDSALVESIFKNADLAKPMPYVEGSFRSCLRYGPERVLLMASNAGTLTCTVRGGGGSPSSAEISSAKQFCVKSVGIRSNLVKCELIFDGQRIVGESRLAKMLNNPSPDIPVVINVSNAERGTHTSLPAVLRSSPFSFYFSSSLSDLSTPQPAAEPIRFSLIAGSRRADICSGTARPKRPGHFAYSGKCVANGKKEVFEGEATMVGYIPVGDRLVPAYETHIAQQGSQVKIGPPGNVIRF
ncbi:MAG: peptidoglycan-binding domain-containing protein [Chromatiaceae bacterium]